MATKDSEISFDSEFVALDARDGERVFQFPTPPTKWVAPRKTPLRVVSLSPSVAVNVWDAMPDVPYMRALERCLEVRTSGVLCTSSRPLKSSAASKKDAGKRSRDEDVESSYDFDRAAKRAVARTLQVCSGGGTTKASSSSSSTSGAGAGVGAHVRAGVGVFTTVRLVRGEILGWFRGRVMSQEQLDKLYGEEWAPYTLAITLREQVYFVDAFLGALTNWVSCVNDVFGTGLQPNVAITELGGIKTLRTIEPGEELLLRYSDDPTYYAQFENPLASKHARMGAIAGFCKGCSGIAPLGATLQLEPTLPPTPAPTPAPAPAPAPMSLSPCSAATSPFAVAKSKTMQASKSTGAIATAIAIPTSRLSSPSTSVSVSISSKRHSP